MSGKPIQDCIQCEGFGRFEDEERPRTCHYCQGRGYTVVEPYEGKVDIADVFKKQEEDLKIKPSDVQEFRDSPRKFYHQGED